MKKLAIIITHPIQYYVPVFRILAKQCQLKVFYTWGMGGIDDKHDPGFGRTIQWDLPLLDGYDYELLENTSKNPGSHHGRGIINPHITNKVAAFSPDAILIYGYIYHSHLKVIKYFKGKIPIWFRGDSTLLDEKNGVKSIIKQLYLNWIYRHIDKAFYVGTNNKAYFKKYGLTENQLIFAPHAVDNQRFSENRALEAGQLRQKLSINPNDILILFAGKLEPKKNPGLLLDAFIELAKDQTKEISADDDKNSSSTLELKEKRKVHLLFVGNGVLEEELKEKAKRYFDELSITISEVNATETINRVHFIDFQNQTQMPVIYQACDIFCLPSKGPGETWGLAVNEAMAAGKAIVVSDKVGCAVDLVKEDVNGYIFKSGDVENLSAKLKLLSNNPISITKFGYNSKEKINNWSFAVQAQQFITVLNAKT